MTTELVLLLCIFAFVTASAIFGPKGPIKVYEKAAPKLGARIEQHLTIGREFKVRNGAHNRWDRASGNTPNGQL